MSEPNVPKVDHAQEFLHEQELLRTTLIAGLASSASELSSVASDLFKAALLSRVQRAMLLIGMFILVCLVGVVGWGVLVLTHTADQNKENGDLIRDCVTPQGQCYQDGSKRSAEAVKTINDVIVAAAACARSTPGGTVEEIRACVVKTLAD